MKSNPFTFILAAICAAALTACGGRADDTGTGGDGAQSPDFHLDEFPGIWIGTDACRQDSYGAYFRLTRMVLTEKTMETTRTVYKDTGCRFRAGLLLQKFDVSWAAGKLAGKTNVARVTTVFTESAIDDDGRNNGVRAEVPVGTVDKLLLVTEGAQLYVSDTDSPRDADGFPTALYPIGIATRQ